jgi:putative endonuclease
LAAHLLWEQGVASSSLATPTFFKMYFVYILQSLRDQHYYIGSTSNLEQRLAYHNSGRQRSTKRRIPFALIHHEIFETKHRALEREKQIKSYKGGEAFKKIISG